MKCPKCQTENRDGIKFCEDCGNKLEIKCPSCGVLISLGKKFCGECGHNLTHASVPSPKALSLPAPQGLTEKILSQKNKIEGERKQVTVMFCDMAGYTSLFELLVLRKPTRSWNWSMKY